MPCTAIIAAARSRPVRRNVVRQRRVLTCRTGAGTSHRPRRSPVPRGGTLGGERIDRHQAVHIAAVDDPGACTCGCRQFVRDPVDGRLPGGISGSRHSPAVAVPPAMAASSVDFPVPVRRSTCTCRNRTCVGRITCTGCPVAVWPQPSRTPVLPSPRPQARVGVTGIGAGHRWPSLPPDRLLDGNGEEQRQAVRGDLQRASPPGKYHSVRQP